MLPDERGSVIGLVHANGYPSVYNSYDEYGIPGPANAGRFQYTGQAWIPELGMYYYKARIYSPTLGRFLQVDPIGYDDQINLYTYVANDPVNLTDSTGEIIDTIADVAFIVSDVADIRNNGLNWTNGISLGANIVGAALPGATGLGIATRGIMSGAQGLSRTGRSRNFEKPVREATGHHSTFRRDAQGNVTHTATWRKNERNPSTGFDLKKRVDVTGPPHTNKRTRQVVPTPHVQGRSVPGGVRPAKSFETPRRCTTGTASGCKP